MLRTLNILGSTGSIGTQALSLVRLHPDRYRVRALTAHSNKELLFAQAREFQPEMAGLSKPIPMEDIPQDLRHIRWVMGPEALHAAAAEVPADMVLVSVVGIAGLQSVMDALSAGRQVLLPKSQISTLTQATSLPEQVEAPIAAQQQLGELTVRSGDTVVLEVPLVAAQAVEKLTWGEMFRRLLCASFFLKM